MPRQRRQNGGGRRNSNRNNNRRGGAIAPQETVKKELSNVMKAVSKGPVIKTVKTNGVKNIPDSDNDSIISKVKEMSKKGYQPTPNALQGSLKEFRTVQTPDTSIDQREKFLKLMTDRRTNANTARMVTSPITSYIGSPYVLPRPGFPNDLPERYGYRNSIPILSKYEPPFGARMAGAQPVQW